MILKGDITMTNYKETIVNLGYSDIASLILVGCGETDLKMYELHFGEDGSYKAYVIDETIEIPAHYTLKFSVQNWLRVYDDDEKTQEFKGKCINVYRAGERGCLIQVIK